MSTEIELSIADVLAEKAALQSQLGQAHEARLLATADAETIKDAVFSIAWMAREWAGGGGSNGPEMRDYQAFEEVMSRRHPGQTLADEVAAARAANAILYEALDQIDKHTRGGCIGQWEPCKECGEMRDIAARALAAVNAGGE